MRLHVKSDIFNKIASFLLAKLLTIISWTVRIKITKPDSNLSINSSKACLLAFWHDQLIPVIWIHATVYKILGNRPIYALISRHNDGRLIANALKYYGIKSIDGSSTSGGTQATLKMLELLDQYVTIAITPDGPRGPKHVAKRGIAKLALSANVPICCVSVKAENAWHLKSWDKMIVPKPFSKVNIIFDEFKFNHDDSGTHIKKRESQFAEQMAVKLDGLCEKLKTNS